MQPQELRHTLSTLRLSGILDFLEAHNRQAVDDQLAYTEFLALLLQDEGARREQRKFDTLPRQAHFRSHKTLEDFNFDRLLGSIVPWYMNWRLGAISRSAPRSSSWAPVERARATWPKHWVMAPFAKAWMYCFSPRAICWAPCSPPGPQAAMLGDSSNWPGSACWSSMTSASSPCALPRIRSSMTSSRNAMNE